MNPIVVIPARLASTRLPNKPLALIAGEPMIVHVWRRAMETGLGPVLVAVDDPLTAETVTRAGGRAILTRADHPSGTDRIAEALATADPDRRHDVVINFQGDLPTVAPHVTRETASLLDDPEVSLATPVALITDPHEMVTPNVVKMVGSPIANGAAAGRAGTTRQRFRALYFTRLQAPWGDGPLYHHIGLYAWRRAAFERFTALPPSTLELREKLEQLRALEAGMRVDAVLVEDVPLGVDTHDDLVRARLLLDPTGIHARSHDNEVQA